METEDNKFGRQDHLEKSLQMAVPMWMLEHADKTQKWLDKRRSICSQTIGEKGDLILYGSKRAGAAGEAFNRLAEGVAILLLITKSKVPFGKIVFMPDGEVKRFETERDAARFVWPESSDK